MSRRLGCSLIYSAYGRCVQLMTLFLIFKLNFNSYTEYLLHSIRRCLRPGITMLGEIPFKVALVLLGSIAFIGNALVCHVIVRLKTMKTSINYIILNLAILDAITGLLAIQFPFIITDNRGISDKFLMSISSNRTSSIADTICRVEWTIWLSFSVSPLLLTIMAYERFKAIVHPLSRLDGTVTKARLKCMLPLAWVVGIAYLAFDMLVVGYDLESEQCVYTSSPYMTIHSKMTLVSCLCHNSIHPPINSDANILWSCNLCFKKTRQRAGTSS